MAYSLPDEKGNITQLNSGDTLGDLYSSFGISLKDGKIKVSNPQKVYFDTVSETSFTTKILGAVRFGTNKMLVLSNKIYYFTLGSFFNYSYVSAGSNLPSPSAYDTGVYFDGKILVSDTDDIHSSTDGATWALWWTGTLGQSALSSAVSDQQPRLMKVGGTGNLYISDSGNKIYYVDRAGSSVVKTGNGTLDFSETNHRFTCMEPTSTRMWIGTKNIGGKAAVIEWDMSVSASTANKIHDIGAEAVRAIVIYHDTPIAILSNGKFKIFDGLRFVDMKGVEIRIPRGYKLAEDFMHRNGWDTMDGLPHILINGKLEGQASDYAAASISEWAMPSGVYAIDPEKGLYHKYSLPTGDVSRDDYAQVSATKTGALIAVDIEETKFLSSYETMETDSTYRATLAYEDAANTYDTKAWIATSHKLALRQEDKLTELFHKPLEAGCSINLYQRSENNNPTVLKGTWADTDTFNTVVTGTGIEKGNIALIKMGSGAGQWVKIKEVTESSTVTSITLETTNSFVTAGDDGTIEVFDFKFMGTIDDTTRDYHSFAFPVTDKKRKRQVLFEITQAAGTEVEIDYIVVNP